jgi:tellurite resistance-related uncharacterized protein
VAKEKEGKIKFQTYMNEKNTVNSSTSFSVENSNTQITPNQTHHSYF